MSKDGSRQTSLAGGVTEPARRRTWWRQRRKRIAVVGVVALLLSSGPWLWTTLSARGHLYDEATAPAADVVIVFGTAVAADRSQPGTRLTGRLQTAAELVHSGRAQVILVSGDGGGTSGDEPAVMTAYLTEQLGIDPQRIVADPHGLDTYDTCARAREVYGINRALIVTQSHHLSRAVTLCRHVGLEADGVVARCSDCTVAMLIATMARDYFASGKAAWDAMRRRPPAVHSPEDSGVQDALRG